MGESNLATSNFDLVMVGEASVTIVGKDVTCQVCLLVALVRMPTIGFVIYSKPILER